MANVAVWKGRRGWTRQWGWVILSLVKHTSRKGLHAKENSEARKGRKQETGTGVYGVWSV